jgi:hypothetical protein
MITLYDRSGARALQDHRHVEAGERLHYERQLDAPVPGGVFVLSVTASSIDARVAITDLRLLGQTPALRTHVERELFRAPPR